MKSMNEQEMRQVNAGSFHCDYCGWATWGKDAMRSHQRAKHGCGSGIFSKKYAYHFHWVGAYNCYTGC